VGLAPFLLDHGSKDAESSFEVYFITLEERGAKSDNYGFTVGQNGINAEWLNYKSKSSRSDYKRIFYRNGKNLDLSGISPRSQENIKIALEKEAFGNYISDRYYVIPTLPSKYVSRARLFLVFTSVNTFHRVCFSILQ
jgi:hypothetical protein